MARAPASSFAVLGAALILLPAAGFAQNAPLTGGAPAAVVGWLAQPSGTVWVAPGAGQPWEPALANQPLEAGEIVATAPDGEAAIGVMAMRTVLGPSTELAMDHLGAGGFSATETAGEIALDLAQFPSGAAVDIATPRGTAEITEPGRYEIAVGVGGQSTRVTAIGGAARMVSGTSVETVYPGQTAILSSDPDGTIGVAITTAHPDSLLRSVIASSPPQPAVAPPPEVAEMTGGASLADYGTWSDVPTYGTVWFPDVPADWVPYRDGRWVYVAPWGWTWVDADPWGFAPFHYGRWVELGPRWGWVPVEPGIEISAGVPVYAPALVNFFAADSLGGVDVTVSASALAAGLIGWVPLGPGEIYRPPFAVGPAYIRRINAYNVRNINRINIDEVLSKRVTISHFVNHRALTTVSFAALADGRQVRTAYRHTPADALAAFRSLPGGAPVRPRVYAPWRQTRRSLPAAQPIRRAWPAGGERAHSYVSTAPSFAAAQIYRRPEPPARSPRERGSVPQSSRSPRTPPRAVAIRPREPSHQAYAQPLGRALESPRSAYVRPQRSLPRAVEFPRTAYVHPPQPPHQPYVRPPGRVEAYRAAQVRTPVRPRPQPEHAERAGRRRN